MWQQCCDSHMICIGEVRRRFGVIRITSPASGGPISHGDRTRPEAREALDKALRGSTPLGPGVTGAPAPTRIPPRLSCPPCSCPVLRAAPCLRGTSYHLCRPLPSCTAGLQGCQLSMLSRTLAGKTPQRTSTVKARDGYQKCLRFCHVVNLSRDA